MLKKVLLMVVLVVAVCSFGVVNVFASEDQPNLCEIYNADEGVTVAAFCDGRLNSTDMDQPVAIYYLHDTVQAYDEDGNAYQADIISGIQLWALNGDSAGQPVLTVPLDRIQSAMTAAQDVQIAANGAYTLNYSPSGDAFWVTGPNGYSFVWEAW